MVSSIKDTSTWPTDGTIVDVAREQELLFWSKRLQVSIGMLRQTVRSVGPRLGDVEAFLNRRRGASAGTELAS